MPDPTETPIQMAERHIIEGGTRIARQEAQIAELDRDGHDHMLPEANKLLEMMRAQQVQAKAHLARLLAKKAGESQD